MKLPRKDYGCPLRIYDNGGKTADRYTILPPRSERTIREFAYWCDKWIWDALSCDEKPYHPQGLGQNCTAVPGRHLGQRISWAELPEQAQRYVRQSIFGRYCPK